MRLLALLLVSLIIGTPDAQAQAPAKKPAAAAKTPGERDKSISVTVFMRDGGKNELLVATRIWPDHPDYNAQALQRFFATMKALEPAYRQDDDAAYTWSTKSKVTKCSIYLESGDAGVKGGTGAVVGCEANGVSNLAVPSVADAKRGSASTDPKHLTDVLDLFKKQAERAKANVPK